MSGFDLINQILNTKTGLSGARKLALLVLAHFSRDGICYPSMQKIADCLEVSEGQARRLINELVDGGFVKKSIQDGRRTNTFQINTTPCINAPLANMQPLQKCKPSENAGSTLADMQGGSYLYNEPIKEPINKGTIVPKEKAATSSLSHDDFLDFWLPCLKKKGKNPAHTAWKRMRKEKRTNLSATELVELYNKAVKVSAAENNGSKKFAPHPSTWINQDRWDDDDDDYMPVTPPEPEPGPAVEYLEPIGWQEYAKQYIPKTQQQIEEGEWKWENLTPAMQQDLTEKCKEL